MGAKPITIGVFDSGIGGLTVVRALIKELGSGNIVYLGDTARVPYGNKSEETIKRFALEDTKFLIEKGVDLIIIACNTVSSVATGFLRKEFPEMPIFEVVSPGVEEAVVRYNAKNIGIIGTIATIKSHAHKRLLNLKGVQDVYEKACPLFVPLAEEGLISGEIPIKIAHYYLDEFIGKIDTLILGCTHYPLLKSVIRKVMGSGVSLIDPAESVARKVREFIEEKNLQLSPVLQIDLFLTDIPPHYHSLLNLFLGIEPDTIEKVDLQELSLC